MRIRNYLLYIILFIIYPFSAKAAEPFISFSAGQNTWALQTQNSPDITVLYDKNDYEGVLLAVKNLQDDMRKVTGSTPSLAADVQHRSIKIIVGSVEKSSFIRRLMKDGKINGKELAGKREKFIIATVTNPLPQLSGEVLVIAGSDKRGTIYGIYELSQQIGVSPWYWWADVPVTHHSDIYVKKGTYTDGEPAVKYRGIFLNDEAPCLTTWVKNTYGTNYGDHHFYARVFELILRLRGNFMWPAMWGWAFYADDELNSKTADEMGIIMGTSHHEPMARNHQEWARNRSKYGKWNYVSNQPVLDKFFAEGIRRMKNTEDIVTIGMRGDGDEAMSENADVELMKRIIKNQRQIIEKETGKAASNTPQVWALYKEVQDYYDKGLRVPDDVTILLSDDNWGNVRRLPNAEERKHPGGWGMYYHVDYVGAPRNTKWINVTPIQNMWEQLQLTYDYGVDRLWVLNVGDLKPMEYPITLFMDMAWNPRRYTAETLLNHTRQFCAQQFGESQSGEAAELLNLSSKYNGRVTPEMLDSRTYNLETGEWRQVVQDFARLEVRALRQYLLLDSASRDAYKQLVLFPIQAMGNLYEMYYAQAMNHKLYADGNPAANEWADLVERDFKRDAELCNDYNKKMSGGKWDGMMTQKHIGYTNWNDNFQADTMPEVYRIEQTNAGNGGYIYASDCGYVSIETEHYFNAKSSKSTSWTIIPFMGRTLSGVALMPYTQNVDGAYLTYKMSLPKDLKTAKIHVVTKSTLAFERASGHRYSVSFEGGNSQTVNFNADLNEKPENIYDKFYPTVARRVVEKVVDLQIPASEDGLHTLKFAPLDKGIVLEKIVIDWGGYKNSYLFMNESSCKRILK